MLKNYQPCASVYSSPTSVRTISTHMLLVSCFFIALCFLEKCHLIPLFSKKVASKRRIARCILDSRKRTSFFSRRLGPHNTAVQARQQPRVAIAFLLASATHPVIAAEGSRQHRLELVNLLALRVCVNTSTQPTQYNTTKHTPSHTASIITRQIQPHHTCHTTSNARPIKIKREAG